MEFYRAIPSIIHCNESLFSKITLFLYGTVHFKYDKFICNVLFLFISCMLSKVGTFFLNLSAVNQFVVHLVFIHIKQK